MASGIFGIAVTGLNAAQAGITTTQNNISNANTAGYRRQEVVYSAQQAQYTGVGYFGTGVSIDTVRSIYSQFLDNEVLQNQSQLSRHETYATQAALIDKMLGDAGSGLSSALDNYFAAVNEVANDPTSNAARQNLLSAGSSLAGRISGLDSKLRDMLTSSNADIQTITQRVNVLSSQIASMNYSIGRNEAVSGQPANDLRDKRDQLVADLNKLVNVSQLQQADGTLNLYVGGGQPLVVGINTYTMTTVVDPNNTLLRQPALNVGGSPLTLSSSLVTGGQLGGILAQREQVLLPVMDDLNRISIAISTEVNAIHRNGLQLDGTTAGGNFFTPAIQQTGGATGWLRLGSGSAGSRIPPENYTASWDGTNFTVTRVSDSTSVTVAPGAEVIMGGASQGFSLFTHPDFPPNVSTGSWSLNLSGFSTSMRMAISTTGEIAAAATAGGPGDNANALALASLRNADLINNSLGSSSRVSFSEFYHQTISRTASLAADADLSLSAYTSLVEQATASQQAVSGVNLDEEAINLIRFQQAYQASARAIEIASSLFDELIGIVR